VGAVCEQEGGICGDAVKRHTRTVPKGCTHCVAVLHLYALAL
jgi:hypothetical protein